MRLDGNVTIRAPRPTVWHFLTDPQAVAWCAPGVTIMHIVMPNRKFKASVAAGFGDIHTTFLTDVEFVEMTPPDQARFRAHGVAPNAAVDVTSAMRLLELPDGTTDMKWEAEVVVVGQLVVLASGRMDMVTRQMIEDFFERMQSRIEILVARLS